MNDPLSDELRAILDACSRAGMPVLVIGAFSVRAYNLLFRVSGDLDLAIPSEHWPRLKSVLASLGFEIISEGLWATASKNVGEDDVEVHVALDSITDFNSAVTFPIVQERPEFHQPDDLDFALPVMPLEAVFLTKLIALRDKDVADLTAILLHRTRELNPSRFWQSVASAGLESHIRDRLDELASLFRGGEAMSTWYAVAGEILTETQQQAALDVIQRLLKRKI
jgi:hypothetical protein